MGSLVKRLITAKATGATTIAPVDAPAPKAATKIMQSLVQKPTAVVAQAPTAPVVTPEVPVLRPMAPAMAAPTAPPTVIIPPPEVAPAGAGFVAQINTDGVPRKRKAAAGITI
jgi:hypothetical protein